MVSYSSEIEKIRKLCNLMNRMISDYDREYISIIFSIDFDEAIIRNPYDLFFLLLEKIVSYAQHIIMFVEIDNDAFREIHNRL